MDGNRFFPGGAGAYPIELWSGRLDLNQRPLAPKASALTMLRHAPPFKDSTGLSAFSRENGRRTEPGPIPHIVG